MSFPIDLKKYQLVPLDVSRDKLPADHKATLLANIQIARDSIVLFTATGAARGVSGHTGGPFDTAPELCILDSLFRTSKDRFVPIAFDEAGHRVASQYFLSALHGHLAPEQLLHYREAHSKLPGHPELGLTPGVMFSSGRLGHLWPMVNGIAMANPEKVVFCLGSDGSQQEGDDAEAARLAVAKNLNVKLILDDNDVTIAGHPSQYLPGYDMGKTLEGHGLTIFRCHGEDIDDLWRAVSTSIQHKGPTAVIVKRVMAPGIKSIEGSPHGHDVIPVKAAIEYLQARGITGGVDLLQNIKATSIPYTFLGSSKEKEANRVQFGESVSKVLDGVPKDVAAKKVMVIDSDLEGSTGLKVIHQKHPQVFVSSGIMERGNFSAAAGFGFDPEKFGVFSTFSAFIEMIISELTMARLNNCNVLSHFSHSGVDEIADNTCHFGVNSMFGDNGLSDVHSWLYFPADAAQMDAVVSRVFFEKGVRFIFSTRSKLPWILKEDGSKFFGGNYKFEPGVDDFILEGKAGYVIAFGDMLHRAYDAVLRCRQKGLDVGLVNKSTLNLVDEKALMKVGSTPFVLVCESFNRKTGLGSKMGTWLLERRLTPKYAYMGTTKEGCGGLGEQIYHQGLDPDSIIAKIKELAQ